MSHSCKKNLFEAECISKDIKSNSAPNPLPTHCPHGQSIYPHHSQFVAMLIFVTQDKNPEIVFHSPLLSHPTSDLSANLTASKYIQSPTTPYLSPATMLIQATTTCNPEYLNTRTHLSASDFALPSGYILLR